MSPLVIKKHLQEAFSAFWKEHPALLYGLSVLLSFCYYITTSYIIIIPLLLLVFAKKRGVLAAIFTLAAFGYINTNLSLPQLDETGITGTAHFAISSIALKSTHFGKHWVYRGTIKSFVPKSGIKNIPIVLSIPLKKDSLRPPADRDYHIEGTLKHGQSGQYMFVYEKNLPWKEIKYSWNSSEIRHTLKKNLSRYIKQKIESSDSATFLSGIATGEFDDRMMTYQFSRFGLQHIMAISGFHFAIISGILGTLLELIFPKKYTFAILAAALTCYFIFLGFSPSIFRAWVMVLIALFASYMQKSSSALNSLGIALIAVLLINPMNASNIGFQFSFLATASILMFYSASDSFLQQFFKKRFLAHAVDMNHLNQLGIIILTTLRKSFALCLAVNVSAFPLMIYHFENFPYFSVIYNLFFPFLISITMLLLIVGFLLPIFPFIHTLNSRLTEFILNFAYNMPQTVDYKLYYSGMLLESLVVYLTLLFTLGVVLHSKQLKSGEEILSITYI
jgi:competence protein ComEC